MARQWRDEENRDRRGWQGEGGGWQGRGDEDDERWGRGQSGGPGGGQSGSPGGEQGYYGREGEDMRHGGQPGRGWAGAEGGGNPDRNLPYSHGGQGHRQSRGQGGSGLGGSGQAGYGYAAGGYGGAGGYGYERDWRQGPVDYGRPYGGREYEQHGARWGQFGGGGAHDGPGRGDPGEETWGPRSQRSLSHWRDSYGTGEDYGRGGGPAGEMDTGHGDYGRDMRGPHMQNQQMQGPHRGKGPKGYQRSPERLKEDICERLSDAPDVDASEISISCKDGIVTLEGSVESRQMKRRAEDIVEACPGVKDVENRLRVQGASQQPDQPGQQGMSNQNRLSTGGPLHH